MGHGCLIYGNWGDLEHILYDLHIICIPMPNRKNRRSRIHPSSQPRPQFSPQPRRFRFSRTVASRHRDRVPARWFVRRRERASAGASFASISSAKYLAAAWCLKVSWAARNGTNFLRGPRAERAERGGRPRMRWSRKQEAMLCNCACQMVAHNESDL